MTVNNNLLRVTSAEVGGSNDESDFHITVTYIVVSIYSLYIPLIIVPSVFVIAAVILMKKLHNAHNVIILAISATDLLVGVFVVPVQLLLFAQSTRTVILNYNDHLCMALYLSSDCIHLVALSMLTLLGFDTFTQIQFPLKYMMYISIKKVIVCIITTAIFDVCISITFMEQFVMKDVRCELKSNTEKVNAPIVKIYTKFISIFYGVHLLLCLFFGLYVRYKQWNRSGKLTTWLLMAFILFYFPTIITAIANKNAKRNDYSMVFARLIGHLFSVTNWMFLCITRPHYKFALKFFLKTKPNKWKNIEKTFRLEKYDSLSKKNSGISKRSKAGLIESPHEIIAQIGESVCIDLPTDEDEEEMESPVIETPVDSFY